MPRVHGVDRSSLNGSSTAEAGGGITIRPLTKSSLDKKEFSSKSFSVAHITDKPADDNWDGDVDIGAAVTSSTGFIGIAPPLHTADIANGEASAATNDTDLSSQPAKTIETNSMEVKSSAHANANGADNSACEAVAEDIRDQRISPTQKEQSTEMAEESVQKNYLKSDMDHEQQTPNKSVSTNMTRQAMTWKKPRSRHKKRNHKDGLSNTLEDNSKQIAPVEKDREDNELAVNSTQSESSSHYIGDVLVPVQHHDTTIDDDALHLTNKVVPLLNSPQASVLSTPPKSSHPESSAINMLQKITLTSNRDLQSNSNRVDFPIVEQNNNMEIQDDVQWSFQPTKDQVTETKRQQKQEESSPKRITRSMGQSAESYPEIITRSVGQSVKIEGGDNRVSNGRQSEKANDTHNQNSSTQNEDTNTTPETRGSPKNKRTKKANTNDMERQSVSSNNSIVRRPRRKRSDGRQGSSSETAIRVMFTGFNPAQRHKEMLQSLGAELLETVEDAAMATHIIVSDGKTKLRRTPKLMICLSKVSKILNIDWLEHSAQQQQIMDTEDFLHTHDAEAEHRYNFSMAKTIMNGIRVRKERGGVLGGRYVYICKGVAGNQAPSAKELQLIIESAGGVLLRTLDSSSEFDLKKTIILTSDLRTRSQMNEKGVGKLVRNGAQACTTSWLFRTVITQSLEGIDDVPRHNVEDPPTSRNNSPMVHSNSQESLFSTPSVSSMKHVGRRKRSNGSVSSSPGSRVSHLESADYVSSPRKRMRKGSKEPQERASLASHSFLSRDQFLSEFSPSTEPFTKDTATIQTHALWLKYYRESGAGSTTPKGPKVRKGVRCRRGRNRILSPLVTCTSTADVHIPESTSRLRKKTNSKPANLPASLDQSDENYAYVSWEAYVLFTLGNRAFNLDDNQHSLSKESTLANRYFPKPISIDNSNKKLSLTVDAAQLLNDSPKQQIFGTLQDLFDLHQKYQFGPIPESVLAQLTIQAIQAVSAIHACGVVHNDITLNSFLITKYVSNDGSNTDSWHLQLVEFGYKSLVINCEEQTNEKCEGDHFEHDYKCLANVIHMLITGGMHIALTADCGHLEYTTKAFLKCNMFMRGALSWCALLDALMCIGNDFDYCHIQIDHPLDVFEVAASDSDPKCRKNQIGWACRLLHEISTTNMSLASFLNGLCDYNTRFIPPNIPSTMFSCIASSARRSFLLCEPENKAAHTPNFQSDSPQTRLSERERAVAHREAKFHTEVSVINDKLQQNQALHESNLESTRILQEKERGIERELRHIEKIKEDILAREHLLELRLQQIAEEYHSCSETESQSNNISSPCDSTQGRSSVGSSIDYRSNKKGRRRVNDRKTHQHQQTYDTMASTRRPLNSHTPAPEHLCSLQNLGSPAVDNRTMQQLQLAKSPGNTSAKKGTRKKVFIDIQMDT